MIDFQSPVIVESANHLAHRSPSPGGEGRDEGELNPGSGRQPALIKAGRVSLPRSTGSLTAVVMGDPCTFASEIRVYRCSSVVKFLILAPSIFNPSQGYANLSKARQAPPPGRGGGAFIFFAAFARSSPPANLAGQKQ